MGRLEVLIQTVDHFAIGIHAFDQQNVPLEQKKRAQVYDQQVKRCEQPFVGAHMPEQHTAYKVMQNDRAQEVVAGEEHVNNVIDTGVKGVRGNEHRIPAHQQPVYDMQQIPY
jgi:hypothetical protein